MTNSFAGVYKHSKTGNLYLVFGPGQHTETGDQLVVYRSFTDPQGPFHIRDQKSFFEKVTIGGQEVDRFRLLTDEEAAEEATRVLEKLIEEASDTQETGCGCGSESCNCN